MRKLQVNCPFCKQYINEYDGDELKTGVRLNCTKCGSSTHIEDSFSQNKDKNMSENISEQAFLEELRSLMTKFKLAVITMNTEQGGIYCDPEDNYFSASDAYIIMR
ncbi:hypothetical protein MKX34_23800 [Paenibacillus sp. FSL R5-0636]|uniref:hypothetical protein n=1 Tax=Paenibacillus TaxID=44249 RepID=UPI00096C718E|nr:hypothetical protein [Paenibacillus odorifer]OMC96199.1 hypothetical protein BJP49_10875 [Paenibacillus odorifer]